MSNTQFIVQAYVDAWTQGRFGVARELLADELKFRGSIDQFDSADDFIAALRVFCERVQGVELHEQYYDGDRAALLYDCVTRSTAGTIRTAEFFRLDGGKIAEIKLVFDATRLRELMGR